MKRKTDPLIGLELPTAAEIEYELARRALLTLKAIEDELPRLVQIASRLEPSFASRYREAIERMRGLIALRDLETALANGQTTEAVALSLVGRLAEYFQTRDTLHQAFFLGAKNGEAIIAVTGVSVSFDLINPQAVSWARAHAGELLGDLTRETQQAVRTLIEQAFTEGRPPAETARLIRDHVGLTGRQTVASLRYRQDLVAQGLDPETVNRRSERYREALLRQRASTIARTEIMTASNQGQTALWQEAKRQGVLDPATTYKRWILTPDEWLCPECREHAEEEVPFDSEFKYGDEPPVHVNCRCTTGLTFKRPKRSD